jgi:hypothetical protein
MADIKISQLTTLPANELRDSDVLIINDVSVATTKQITFGNLLADYTKNVVDSGTGAKVAGDFNVTNELTIGGDTFTTGKVTFGSLQDYTNDIFVSKFVNAADGIENNLTDSSIPTSKAVFDYVTTATTANIAGKLSVDSAGSQVLLYPTMVSNTTSSGDSVKTDPDLSYNALTRTLTTGNITPLADSAYDLGSTSRKWKDLYLSGSTIYLGNKRIEVSGDDINFADATNLLVSGEVIEGGGGAGVSPAFVKLEPQDGTVIQYDSTGSIESTTLNFKAIAQNFDSARTFQFFVGGVLKQTNTVSIDSATFQLGDGSEPAAGGQTLVKVSVLNASGDSAANDFVSIVGIRDGASSLGIEGLPGVDAVSGYLTNEVHTEAADSAGVLTDNLTDAGGVFKILVGDSDVTGLTGQVTYTVQSETGIDASIAANGTYTIGSFDSVGSTSGVANLRAVVAASLIPNASTAVTIDKQYSIAKLLGGSGKDGAAGAAGVGARAVKILPLNGQVVRYDSVGAESTTLTFSASPENGENTLSYKWSVKEAAAADGTYVVKQNGGPNYTLADGDEPTVSGTKVIKCEMFENTNGSDSAEKAQDIVSVYGLVNGFETNGYLTNEAHIEPADSTGAPTTALNDGGGTFKVFLGSTDITTGSGVTFANTSNTGINVGINSTTGVYTLNSFASDATVLGTASFTATIPHEVIPGIGIDKIIERQYSVAKSVRGSTGPQGTSAGDAGLNARTVKLSPDAGQVVRYSADGVTETDTLTFTAENNDEFTGTENWSFELKKGAGASFVEKRVQNATSTFTLADGDEPGVDSSYVLSVKSYEDNVVKAKDFVTIFGIQEGQSISTFLTNEAHVEAYDSAGIIIGDLTDAGGTFKVFRGNTEITSNCTFSVDAVSGLSASIGASNGIYTIDAVGPVFKANADFQVVIPAAQIPNGTGTLTIDKRYSFTKSIRGGDGSPGANATPVVLSDLTNENHSIPTDVNGNNGNFTGATTTLQILLDNEVDTANWNITTTASNCTITGADTATVAVTAISADIATVTFVATRTGYPNQGATFSLSRIKAGATGLNATAYSILTSASIIKANQINTIHTPPSITMSQQRLIGGGTPTVGDYGKLTYFVTNASVEGAGVDITSASGSYTLQDSDESIRIIQDVGGVTVDTETIPVVLDGIQGSNGTSGGRGAGRWHIDVDAVDYASATATGALPASAADAAEAWDEGVYVGTAPGTEVSGDQAWFYKGDISAPTSQKVYIYNGTSWVVQTEAIDGNLIVAGTVTADEFATGFSNTETSVNVGQTIIAGDKITIKSYTGGSYVTRVIIGDLS